MTYKTVLTYGTFDLFHIGHLRLLHRLSDLADRVIVACSTDAFNAQKGKVTAIPFDQRVEILKGCRYVDLVIPERNWAQKPGDIAAHDVDLFAMGDDWTGHFDDLNTHCAVMYLPRTDHISSTLLKSRIQTRFAPIVARRHPQMVQPQTP